MTDHRRRAPRQLLRRTCQRLLSWLTSLVLVLLVLSIGAGVWAVRSGRWQAHPVLSGSMQPTLAVGSIAVVERVPTDSLRRGDVITFREPGEPTHLITHRIASIREKNGRRVYETKGDANATKDPWEVTLRGASSYRLTKEIPFVGHAAVWLRQPETRRWSYGAAALFGLWAVVQLFLPDHWWRRSTAAPGPDKHDHTEVST